jgi:hypothetical protein
VRAPGETPGQFAQRAVVALPVYAKELEQITRQYNAIAYTKVDGSGGSMGEALGRFTRAVNRFKPARRRGVIDETVSS